MITQLSVRGPTVDLTPFQPGLGWSEARWTPLV